MRKIFIISGSDVVWDLRS